MLRQPVSRGTHWYTSKIWNTSTNWWLIDFRWPEVWKRIERECYKNEGSTKKDVPLRKQAIPSRKSQCLPKRNAPITASHLIKVFSVTVSSVADTLWSVHIKIDFHQKKTMLKAETEAIKRQRKDCKQSKHEKRDEQTITFSQCC